MGHRDELVEQFRAAARRAAEDQQDPKNREAFRAARAAVGLSEQAASSESLHDHDVDVTAEWHGDDFVVLVFGDEPLLVLQINPDGTAGAVFPLGKCRRCGATVPLGPSVRSPIEFGRVLEAGTPVGHACPQG